MFFDLTMTIRYTLPLPRQVTKVFVNDTRCYKRQAIPTLEHVHHFAILGQHTNLSPNICTILYIRLLLLSVMATYRFVSLNNFY